MAAGIHHEPTLSFTGAALAVGEFHPDSLISVKYDVGDLMSFKNRDPLGLSIVQQYLIELRPPDLI